MLSCTASAALAQRAATCGLHRAIMSSYAVRALTTAAFSAASRSAGTRAAAAAGARLVGAPAALALLPHAHVRRYWAGVGRRYIPFQVSQEQARAKIAAWSKGQTLASGAFDTFLRSQNPQQHYYPFWVFEVKVSVAVEGRVGYDRTELQFNHSTNRFEQRTVTEWRPLTAAYESSHANDADAEMQIDAAMEIRGGLLPTLKAPPGALPKSLPFDPAATRYANVVSPVVGSQEAWRSQVEPLIHRRERENAARLLRQKGGGSRVVLDRVELNVRLARCFPVALPSYIVPFSQGALTQHVVVSGVTGAVAGDLLYSTWRTTLAGGLGGLALGVLGALAGADSSVLSCALVGAACAYVYARGGAALFAWLEAGLRGLAAASLKHSRPHFDHFGFEFEAASEEDTWGYQQQYEQYQRNQQQYGRQQQYSYGQQQRQQQGRQQGYGRQQQQGQQPGRGRGRTHYDVLGVPRSATTEEIKTAFRKEALKWHPDRQTDPAKKAESERRFKEVNEAYRTLRNDQDRRRYDATL
eukprot:tig00001574_g9354.t1